MQEFIKRLTLNGFKLISLVGKSERLTDRQVTITTNNVASNDGKSYYSTVAVEIIIDGNSYMCIIAQNTTPKPISVSCGRPRTNFIAQLSDVT